MTQTTQRVTVDDLTRVTLESSPKVTLHPLDTAVADAFTSISRDVLTDPWDRFIVATAKVLAAPLVTRDEAIQQAKLVPTLW